ncbi:hypothetical protein RMSM_05689 [Rhodopirellula maiorica SM1]|uniref:Uncharacterized protein n=1 Tax=Rhodopirellula maiorica SM1 TaxID=1265738 RepID=M5RDC1_9BACT|nr:hypothetical protein RMSM_05689 [Rhodopirellula maiorica SM1]
MAYPRETQKRLNAFDQNFPLLNFLPLFFDFCKVVEFGHFSI